MNDPNAMTSEYAGKETDIPVEGYGLVGVGAYLVLFTLTVVVVIWAVIPSCDVAGFVVTRLTPPQVLTTGGEDVRIAGEGFEPGVKVRIGNKAATTSVISPFEIAVITPQLPTGRVAVTVEQEGSPPIDVPGDRRTCLPGRW